MTYYTSVILADNPAGYWRLNDTSGTAATALAGSNGTYTAGYTLNQGAAVLRDGAANSVNFNGTTGFVAGGAIFTSITNFTLECWGFKTAAGQGGSLGQADSGFGTATFYMRVGGNGGFQGVAAYREVACANGTLSTWHHYVLTYDGATIRFYLDGVASGTPLSTTDTPLATSGHFSIGRVGDFDGQYFTGNLAEAAVYTTALSAARILAHYTAAAGPKGRKMFNRRVGSRSPIAA